MGPGPVVSGIGAASATASPNPPLDPRTSASASWAAAVSSSGFEGLTRKLGRLLAIWFWNLTS